MLDHFTHGAKLVSGMTFFYEVRGQLSKRRYEERTRVMLQPQTQYQTKVHVDAEDKETDFLKTISTM